jgi:TRAP transporter TAXI family solute receptor
MKKITAIALTLLIGTGSTLMAAGSQDAGAQKDKPAAKTDIIIGTAGTAGTYYIVAAAMAQAVNNHSSRLNVIAQPSKGSLENINLAQNGDIQLGMSNADGVYWATTGTGTYQKAGARNISAVMSLYMSVGQMATTKSSGIKTYADLKSKKVCLGPPSTTIVEMSKAILRGYGINPEKDITPFYLSIEEGLSKLTDGEIDASFFVAGIPTAGMINASSTGNISFVEASDEVLNKVASENPYFNYYKIPAGTYKGQDKDIGTLKIMTEIFANNDVPEDVVFEFVKLALENTPDYLNAHTVVKEINAKTAASTVSKLHPGALKYYKSIGIKK